jgi:predicted ATPase
MTIVERAARAAMDEVSRQTDGNWPADETGLVALVDYHLDFSDLARAVLQAIREPSDDMEAAGKDALGERGCNPLWGDAGACYQAMIDTALTE